MRKTKVKNRIPPFVPLLWDMLNAKAYKTLPPTASKMLPYFLGKVKLPGNFRDPQYYETTFTFTYTEAQTLGCARKTFYQVIRALVRLGFIDPVKKGGLRGCNLSFNIFKLSSRWKKYDTAQFVPILFECFEQHQIKEGLR
jgi:hypothetical protein